MLSNNLMKFICVDQVPVYFDISKLDTYSSLNDADSFKEIFSNDNLNNFNDDSGNNLLISLNISCTDWLELVSFIKNNQPMYYSYDLLKDPNKKESFIYNLEKLNKTCNKLGGLNSFDKFYQKFMKTANEKTNALYSPLEPTKDYKNMYLWGVGGLTDTSQMITTFAKYSNNEGWSTTKTFTKNGEAYVWFRKLK